MSSPAPGAERQTGSRNTVAPGRTTGRGSTRASMFAAVRPSVRSARRAAVSRASARCSSQATTSAATVCTTVIAVPAWCQACPSPDIACIEWAGMPPGTSPSAYDSARCSRPCVPSVKTTVATAA
ncbi:hypothetical protein ACIRQQ_04890 [Streptomyces fuscichromogenes]|uniref:hypothetical protein n=1 Tax=Streptomyces fuscichromogenes TaxID=1324013 RepID=UPI0037FF520F